MSPSQYTVATAEQLKGFPQKRRVKKRQDQILQLPCLEADMIHEPSGTLRHERRKISHEDILVSTALTLDTQQKTETTTPNTAGDIYFSPIEVSPRTACLSDPVLSHESTVLESSAFTKMLALFPKAPTAPGPNKADRPSRREDPTQLAMLPTDLDGLMVALTNCPLIRSSLHERYPHNVLEVQSSQTSSASSSQPNKLFVPSSPSASAPYFELTSTTLGTVTVLDATKPKQKLQASSNARDFAGYAATASHSYITLSNETSYASTLHVIRGDYKQDTVKVALQILNTGIDRKTYKPVSYISVERDVTDVFKKAALAELAQHADVSAYKIMVSAGHESDPKSFSVRASDGGDWQDWMLLVEELQLEGEMQRIVETVLTSMQDLNAESCSMQTLTLMSELSRTITSSVDCITVKIVPRAGKRSHAEVLQTSRSMAAKLDDMDCYSESSPTDNRASRVFLRKICSMVIDNEQQRAAYKVNGAYSLTQMFENVPMYDTAGEQPYAWMVFVQPGFKRWQMI